MTVNVVDDGGSSSSEESCVSSLDLDDDANNDSASESGAGLGSWRRYSTKPVNPHHPVWSHDWLDHPPTLDMWVAEFETRMGKPYVTQHMVAIQATYKACYFNDPYFFGFGDRPISSFIFHHHDGYKVGQPLFRWW